MVETQEHQVEVDNVELSETLLRRSERLQTESMVEDSVEKFSLPIPPVYRIYIILFSIILAGLSVTIPTFFEGASQSQMEGLYIAKAFLQGQVPYVDVFATGGLLYYAGLALAEFLGSSMWLIFLEFILYLMAGWFFFKLTHFLTGKVEMAAAFTPLFYLLNFGLGLGGLYASQWANAFVLAGLWLLVMYFMNYKKDEWFILYGILAAISLFIDVHTIIFWILAFLVLTVYNIAHKRWKQGFYQNLCILWGLLLVGVVVGYYALNLQVLKPYIDQTIIYGLGQFGFGQDDVFLKLSFQVLILLGSGLAYGLLFFFGHLKKEPALVGTKWLLFLTGLFYAVDSVLSLSFDTDTLLGLLPFGLLLTALAINHAYEKRFATERTYNQILASRDAWSMVMKRHLYLPCLVALVGLGLGVFRYVTHAGLSTERSAIAQYLEENSTAEDEIYVWDTTTTIYDEANRLSSSQFILPGLHTDTTNNENLLIDQLLQHQAKYIVVSKSLTLPATVQADLESAYQEMSAETITHFKLYQLK